VDIRIVLTEDSPHYRASLETFFRHAPGFELVAVHGSAESLLEELRDAGRRGTSPPWEMALMDIELPGMNGIEATRILKEQMPGISVVMLTVFEEPSVILEAIGAGADGYLLKKTSSKELLTQLGTIVSGGAPLTSGVARTLLGLVRNGRPHSGEAPARLDLTDREQEVLRCLVDGQSYQEAADHLGITLHTVRYYIRAIYKKLKVHSAAAAVRRAVRERLV
jgi:DNA-binding NarL/FixJ family response regulator